MRAYLDHAATTPMRRVAVDAWVEHSSLMNPASTHSSGRRARSVLDDARELIASLMGCEPIEVIFTASGTEADNLAVQGLYHASNLQRVITTGIEHPAVDETVRVLPGVDVDKLPVSTTGHVTDLAALDTPAALATCIYANNETGAIQPIEEIVARAGDTPVHVDAVQAVGRIPINFAELGVTTLAASAHKFGGPRGAGFLIAQRSPAPSAVLHGGGQERGIRPGTVDVASAAAMAAALAEAVAEMEEENARLASLRDRLRDGIVEKIADVTVNTHEPALPGHLHVSLPGTDGDSIIMLLDVAGIDASTGSACHAGVHRMSHVLEAMGISTDAGLGSLRLTLGHTTTATEVDVVLERIADVVKTARLAGLR